MLKELSIQGIVMMMINDAFRFIFIGLMENVILRFGSVAVAGIYPFLRISTSALKNHFCEVLFGRDFVDLQPRGENRTWRSYFKWPSEIHTILNFNFHRIVQYEPFNRSKLVKAENILLQQVGRDVTIERHVTPVFAHMSSIYSIFARGLTSDYDPEKTPLVLLHELGAGVGYWARNIGTFASQRPTYALDMFGFGQSERIHGYPDCPATAEEWFVKSLEEWREAKGIEKMILLGHRLGGFVAASYAILHPERVRHLVLCEPWGFVQRQTEENEDDWIIKDMPAVLRVLPWALSKFNALDILRVSGHFGIGPTVIACQKPNLGADICPDNPEAAYEYLHQVNADYPTGEIVYGTMSCNNWAKRPMNKRFLKLDPNVPVTFILSDHEDQNLVKVVVETARWRQQRDQFTYIQNIRGGTQPNVNNPEAFNNDVLVICKLVDQNVDRRDLAKVIMY
ncbi:hypothetical protein QR680_004422 [Steinernema hermaphroditum]|uniref:AB hydrolase-1 domain-containing protein n=1 Tax=Steinernema hermaphroditum TaxID=289476 RepID=A0AA39LT57_9BILA|nr:hypothetical protein QR680_004422 [Steinernema hermaphroditum]